MFSIIFYFNYYLFSVLAGSVIYICCGKRPNKAENRLKDSKATSFYLDYADIGNE